MIILECGKSFDLIPWKFSGIVDNKPFYRIGWLYFTIAYTSLSLKQYFDAIKKDEVIWKEQ